MKAKDWTYLKPRFLPSFSCCSKVMIGDSETKLSPGKQGRTPISEPLDCGIRYRSHKGGGRSRQKVPSDLIRQRALKFKFIKSNTKISQDVSDGISFPPFYPFLIFS